MMVGVDYGKYMVVNIYVWHYVLEMNTLWYDNYGVCWDDALCYSLSRLVILYNDIEEYSGSILYLDLKLLSCFISPLYYNLAQSADDAYWVPVFWYPYYLLYFLVHAQVLVVAVELRSCRIDHQKIG